MRDCLVGGSWDIQGVVNLLSRHIAGTVQGTMSMAKLEGFIPAVRGDPSLTCGRIFLVDAARYDHQRITQLAWLIRKQD
jgi:hypothetical protein